MALQPAPSIFGNGRLPSALLHLKGKIFLFFNLPLELRQQIYDKTLGPEQVTYEDAKKRVRVLNHPRCHLLLVSRQFRDELTERASKFRTLAIEGYVQDNPPFVYRTLQAAPTMALRFVMVYKASPSHYESTRDRLMGSYEFDNLKTQVLRLLPQLTTSRQVTVDLYLRVQQRPSEERIDNFHAALCSLLDGCKFLSFNVYIQNRAKSQPGIGTWQPWKSGFHRQNDKLIIRYSHETKSLERVTKKKEDVSAEQLAELMAGL